MKGFLIGLAIIVALGVGLITQYEFLGEKLLAQVEAEAGTPEKLRELQSQDPKKLVEIHAPLLKKRWNIAYAGLILNNDDFFIKVCRSTLAYYADTELQTDPNYGRLLFELAKISEQKCKPPGEASRLFKKYVELFPAAKDVQVAKNAITNMTIKYGIQ